MKLKIKKTKAAVLFNINKPLKILNINLPETLKKNQVLIKNLYSGICGTQIAEYKGFKNNKTIDWLLFGLFSALGILSKYLFIYLLVAIDVFFYYMIIKKKINMKSFISLIAFFLILLPRVAVIMAPDESISFILGNRSQAHNFFGI